MAVSTRAATALRRPEIVAKIAPPMMALCIRSETTPPRVNPDASSFRSEAKSCRFRGMVRRRHDIRGGAIEDRFGAAVIRLNERTAEANSCRVVLGTDGV